MGQRGMTPQVTGSRGAERREPPTHGAESPFAQAHASLDALFATAARQALHWRLMTIRLPPHGATQVTVVIEEAASLHPYPGSTPTLDAATAGVMQWEPFGSYNLGRTIRAWVRPVHTGEAGDFLGQLIAALASAGGAVLVYTGLALAWRRWWHFIKRHRRTGQPSREDVVHQEGTRGDPSPVAAKPL